MTVDRPAPVPGPDQILIRVKAAALNHSDLTVLRGQYSRATPEHMVLCSDGAGDVIEIGSAVTQIAKGDRVMPIFMPNWIQGPLTEAMMRQARGRTIDGMLAEYVAVNHSEVVKTPAHLSHEEAAALPTAAVTAWNAIVGHGNLQPGETVLTLGTGGVSMFAIQFALSLGAQVIATSGSALKLERLKAMGVAAAIDYRSTADWGKRVRDITHGGVDHVVEVGGAGTLKQSLRAVRVGGRISLIGALSGKGELNPIPIVMKSINVQGIYCGSRKMFEEMNDFITLQGLHPVIDQVFDYSRVVDAFRYLESGRHFGKICVRL
jgi:NADPH:quinone reductase-like Zn-dependent oxidoreductase